jgi:hypothetical protein
MANLIDLHRSRYLTIRDFRFVTVKGNVRTDRGWLRQNQSAEREVCKRDHVLEGHW